MADKKSKLQKLQEAFASGKKFTANQIASRFGVLNPRDLIYRLRQDGWDVALFETVNSRGELVRKYAMHE